MMIREAAFAGRFYAAKGHECLESIAECLRRAAETPAIQSPDDLDRIAGAVVPHAGWVFSGGVAARVIQEIAKRPHPQVVVIFGAIHVLHGNLPTVFPAGAWETPLGLISIDDRLADRLMGSTGLLENNPHAHENEHSIEVEVPFIQHMLPESLIIPIMVPVNDKAVVLGKAVGRACRDYGVKTLFLCSTDLTHYGSSFRFTPQGEGDDAFQWSMDVNDRRMIDLMLRMRTFDAVKEAVTHKNACGGGAIAATLAACDAYGAKQTRLLEHTASHEVSWKLFNQGSTDTVGYAGLVIG